jgi:hypothetical protein
MMFTQRTEATTCPTIEPTISRGVQLHEESECKPARGAPSGKPCREYEWCASKFLLFWFVEKWPNLKSSQGWLVQVPIQRRLSDSKRKEGLEKIQREFRLSCNRMKASRVFDTATGNYKLDSVVDPKVNLLIDPKRKSVSNQHWTRVPESCDRL